MPLDLGHVLLRSPKWTPLRSPVLARERVPLGLGHVLCRSLNRGPLRSQVLARERVPLGLVFHMLFRSPTWTLARSPVLAREPVPLELVHVLSRRPLQTLGLPAVRGGQQVPEVGGIRRQTRGAPQMKFDNKSLTEITAAESNIRAFPHRAHRRVHPVTTGY